MDTGHIITFQDIHAREDVKTLIRRSDETLKTRGYTEHSFPHVTLVLERAASILRALGHPERMVELVRIAGFMHDIGNLVNRHDHAQSSAVMAFQILDKLGMPMEEVADIVCAIANHDEGTGLPVTPMAAALIIADKTDVRRNRVRLPLMRVNDIHDRVNGAVDEAGFEIDGATRTLTLSLTIDTKQCAVLEYFQIFLNRMQMCDNAAKSLQCSFRLTINGALMMG